MKALVTKDRVRQLRQAMNALTKRQLLVGIPDENADRQPDPHDPTPITNAGIGYVMEKGDPELNIPARPFLGPGIEDAIEKIGDRLVATAKVALGGDVTAVDRGLHGAGLIGQNAVRAKISNGPFIPLSPVTLARRRARGRTGTKPLIDTTQLQRSVTYVIRSS